MTSETQHIFPCECPGDTCGADLTLTDGPAGKLIIYLNDARSTRSIVLTYNTALRVAQLIVNIAKAHTGGRHV